MRWLQGVFALGLGLATVLAGPGRAWSAERLGVFLPPLIEFSLPVEDLARFAHNGAVSRQLDFYLRRLTPEQQAALADLLTRDFDPSTSTHHFDSRLEARTDPTGLVRDGGAEHFPVRSVLS